MSLRWNDVRPGSPVVENLEFLRTRALQIRAKMLSPLEEVGLDDDKHPLLSALAKVGSVSEIEKFAKDKESIIGSARAARILFLNTPTLFTEGSDAELKNSGLWEAWVNAVIVNIEAELREIDAQRSTLISLFAAVMSMLAAVGSMVAAIVALFWHSTS